MSRRYKKVISEKMWSKFEEKMKTVNTVDFQVYIDVLFSILFTPVQIKIE